MQRTVKRTLKFSSLVIAVCFAFLTACGQNSSDKPNNPHTQGAAASNTLFTAFTERSPKHLDPTSSYSGDETPFTYQIYEPLYTYHYLKRPYELEPLLATALPTPSYIDAKGKPVSAEVAEKNPALVTQSWYDITIKQGVLYAPHPAFARDSVGEYLFHGLKAEEIKGKYAPKDFGFAGTREMTAEDIAYSIKRLATPRVQSPIFGHLSDYIVGLKELNATVKQRDTALRKVAANLAAGKNGGNTGAKTTIAPRDLPFLDFRQFDLSGVQVLDKYTLRIKVKGVYPQFKYWLATTFFAPIPWESEKFYAQTGMAGNNLSLNTWPVGTGPYYLSESLTNRKHVLSRSPNYRGGTYPCEGEVSSAGKMSDEAAGLLKDCGKRTPFIDRIEFSLEKEALALESKFFNGYYDIPQAQRGEFGTAYLLGIQDATEKGAIVQNRNIALPAFIDTTVWYTGFNWNDPVVGGANPATAARNKKLRQAIAIAWDTDEFVGLFEQGMAITAMSPIPPGIEGFTDINPQIYDTTQPKNSVGQHPRKSIDLAKQLMREAGYPNGRDTVTGKPLTLYIDVMGSESGKAAQYDWEARQLEKLGIQMEIRATDYNRFQDKMSKGAAQIFSWGWGADYPDAENFLFLLYGPNAKAKNDGENASNYQNPQYDALFERMKTLPDGAEKTALIAQMIAIAQQDVPWLFGHFPKSAGAYHTWVKNGKPTQMIRNHLQYIRLDTEERVRQQTLWNTPQWWGLILFLLAAAGLGYAGMRIWRHKMATVQIMRSRVGNDVGNNVGNTAGGGA